MVKPKFKMIKPRECYTFIIKNRHHVESLIFKMVGSRTANVLY